MIGDIAISHIIKVLCMTNIVNYLLAICDIWDCGCKVGSHYLFKDVFFKDFFLYLRKRNLNTTLFFLDSITKGPHPFSITDNTKWKRGLLLATKAPYHRLLVAPFLKLDRKYHSSLFCRVHWWFVECGDSGYVGYCHMC